MSLLRRVIGGVLRRLRLRQGRTLREVAAAAGVSVPYLSEVERGRKEASSEVLAAICRALGIRLSDLLEEARDDLRRVEPRVPTGPRADLSGANRLPVARRGGATASPTRARTGPLLQRGPGGTGPVARVGVPAGPSHPDPRRRRASGSLRLGYAGPRTFVVAAGQRSVAGRRGSTAV
ncbi:helix-turn-helix domain-containing protein [Micromonospora endolithica]|uniref:XRE family transcriptional regulator n=1 Tax=Micromonospora endolithica TaxID=230091 RepID=A0A3A9YY57_9ACTN|nr:helix-turn-helix transcriptional regulator [Micromonospora endolithica]RKN40991.1 XRE family transcriptional regulator [Micromonospora endolithica]TWJ24206.1 helix-turn-helix protein [Micromonospora endolithica]